MNDGLLIVLQEVSRGGQGLKVDPTGSTQLNSGGCDQGDSGLVDLECTLLRTDSKYKLTKDQRQNWIKYMVTKEFPPGMPWEDAEEKKKAGEQQRMASVGPPGVPARLQANQDSLPNCKTAQVVATTLGQHGIHRQDPREQQPTMLQDTLHSDSSNPRLGPAKPWGSVD